MKNPRKLVRIAIVLLATVLLFNFTGYYLVYLRSQENEQYVQVHRIANEQRMLSQIISKDIVLLTRPRLTQHDIIELRKELQSAVDTFVVNNDFLKNKVGTLSNTRQFDIKMLHTHAQVHFKDIIAISRDVLKADSARLTDNRQAFRRDILLKEKSYSPLLSALSHNYSNIISDKMSEATTINTGKFISLIVAFVCLVFLVLEPLFRSNQRNFEELKRAQNELQKEKTYFSSILNS